MKGLSKFTASVAAGVALLATCGTASALTYQGAEFSSSVTGSGTAWALVMTMDFTNADANNEFLGDMMEAWSLTLPGDATIGFTTGTNNQGGVSSSFWSINPNAQADATGCGGGQVNAICVDWGALNVANGGGPVIDKGDIFTFSIDITFAASQNFTDNWGNFHLLSVRESKCTGQDVPDANGKCYKKDGGLISKNLSDTDTDTDTDTDVPEPGTLALLGLGLLGLGAARRRRA